MNKYTTKTNLCINMTLKSDFKVQLSFNFEIIQSKNYKNNRIFVASKKLQLICYETSMFYQHQRFR
jgi:hypothetical protein